MDVASKRILLTGASSGVGRELAIELGRAGAVLAIASRRGKQLAETASEVVAAGGVEPAVITADLSVRGEARRLGTEALRRLGQLDVVVNNAAMHTAGSQWALSDGDDARELWETNYWSPLALAGILIPAMLERRSGLVVNISSVVQVTTWPQIGHYASSKAAASIASETLRMELQSSGMRVLHVVPGPVKTKMYEDTKQIPGIKRMTSLSPLGDPAVLSRRIVRAIERDKDRVVYPSANNVPLHFPRSAQRLLARLAKRSVDTSELHVPKELVVVDSAGDPSARKRAKSVR